MDFKKMLQMVPYLNDEDLLMQIKLFDLGTGPITSISEYLKYIYLFQKSFSLF